MRAPNRGGSAACRRLVAPGCAQSGDLGLYFLRAQCGYPSVCDFVGDREEILEDLGVILRAEEIYEIRYHGAPFYTKRFQPLEQRRVALSIEDAQVNATNGDAWEDSGTMCRFRIFMRSAGTRGAGAVMSVPLRPREPRPFLAQYPRDPARHFGLPLCARSARRWRRR